MKPLIPTPPRAAQLTADRLSEAGFVISHPSPLAQDIMAACMVPASST